MDKEEQAPIFNLRDKVLSGGLALTVRGLAGFAVAALGNIILVRLLSLADYGIYAVAAFWLAFLNNLLEAGISTYIIKSRDGQIRPAQLLACLTILQVFYLIAISVSIFGISPLLSRWYGNASLYYLLILISIPLYLNLWARIPMALLERDLQYKKIGVIEWTSQLLYYVPAVLAAWKGFGVFSLLLGEISKSVSQTLLAWGFRRVRLGWSWERRQLWEIARFGVIFKGANLIWDINGAVAPVLVGKLVGLEALGLIRVAQGILNQLSFFQGIIWRISVPAIARIQGDKERVARLVTQSAYAQIILVGFPIFAFAGLSYWLVPLLYGTKWQAAPLVILISSLYPVFHAVFFMQISPFFATGRAYPVTVFNVSYMVVLWSLSFILTSWFGYLGFCTAGYFLCLPHVIAYYYFKKCFYEWPFFPVASKIIVIYLISILSYVLNNPPLSILILCLGMTVFLFFNKEVRSTIKDLQVLRHLKPAPSEG